MNRVVLFCLIALSSQCVAFDFWDDLRVRWDFTPTENAYVRMPRNTVDAARDGWVLESESCSNGGRFNGFRWMFPSDTGVSLLFDTNNDVVGMQSLVEQSELLFPEQTYKFDKVGMYQNHTINDTTYFVITVYFIDPAVICGSKTVGPMPRNNIGTYSQVFFQTGPTPNYVRHAPKTRAAATNLGWTVNQCVPGMGWHNFYEVDKYEEHDCNEVQPTCILYDENDNMIGYCLTYPGMASGGRWEHPSAAAVGAVLGNAPQCILDQAENFGATTTHIYFTNTPWKIGC